MGMREICSYSSYWRGLEYFENNRVKLINKINEYEYEAEVEGTENYHVHLKINHPRKSTCTCPHAAGKSTICKHKMAVYFSIFPDEAQEAIDEKNRYYEHLEEREREYDKKAEKIRKMLEKDLLTIWFMIIWKMKMIRMMKMTVIKLRFRLSKIGSFF